MRSKIGPNIVKAMCLLHEETGREYLKLKQIYERVELLQGHANSHGGASIRAFLEHHCAASDVYQNRPKKPEVLFAMKSKKSGLWKSLTYAYQMKLRQLVPEMELSKSSLLSLFHGREVKSMMNSDVAFSYVLTVEDEMEEETFLEGNYVFCKTLSSQDFRKEKREFQEAILNGYSIFLFQKKTEEQFIFLGEAELEGDPSWNMVTGEVKIPLRRLTSLERTYQELEERMISLREEPVEFLPESIPYVEGLPNLRTFVPRQGRSSSHRSRPNYLARQVAREEHGRFSEERIFEQEKRRVSTYPNAASYLEKMDDFFRRRNDTEGYDILSFDYQDGVWKKRYIEVKSTVGGESTPIDITREELEFALQNKESYFLYRIVKSDSLDCYYKIIPGTCLEEFHKEETSYRLYQKNED